MDVAIIAPWCIVFAQLALIIGLFWRIDVLQRRARHSTDDATAIGGTGVVDMSDPRPERTAFEFPSEPERAAALAMSALHCEDAGMMVDRLELLPMAQPAFDPFFERFTHAHRWQLRDVWLDELIWLQEHGHRRQLAGLRAIASPPARAVSAASPSPEPPNPTSPARDSHENWLSEFAQTYRLGHVAMREQQLVKLARSHREGIDALDGTAYDCSLYGLMIRAGVRLGYLDADDAWQLLIESARFAAAKFSTWAAFSEDVIQASKFFVGDNAGLNLTVARAEVAPSCADFWQQFACATQSSSALEPEFPPQAPDDTSTRPHTLH